MTDILQITDTPFIDKSIEEYEYHEYETITGTSLNNGGDISISIESQHVFTNPSESHLIYMRVIYKQILRFDHNRYFINIIKEFTASERELMFFCANYVGSSLKSLSTISTLVSLIYPYW